MILKGSSFKTYTFIEINDYDKKIILEKLKDKESLRLRTFLKSNIC